MSSSARSTLYTVCRSHSRCKRRARTTGTRSSCRTEPRIPASRPGRRESRSSPPVRQGFRNIRSMSSPRPPFVYPSHASVARPLRSRPRPVLRSFHPKTTPIVNPITHAPQTANGARTTRWKSLTSHPPVLRRVCLGSRRKISPWLPPRLPRPVASGSRGQQHTSGIRRRAVAGAM